ncbi:MAG TPA: hypothetical protein VGJ81_05445 [Thermoanaerobaculia bacterium]
MIVLALLSTAQAWSQPRVNSAFLNTASFPDPNKPKELVIVREDNTLDPSNACPDIATCTKMYRLEDRGDTYRTYDIESVRIAGTTLTADLAEVPTSTKKLTFVAFNLKATPKIGYLEMPVSPQLLQLDVDETEAFEGLRSPVIVQYQALTPLTIKPNDERRTRAAISSALAITDAADFDRPYPGYVESIAPVGQPAEVFELRISGAPRGKKLNLQLGGLETFNGQAQQATTTIQTIAIPKGRADATLYLQLSAEANDVKRERKYTIDTRVHDVWRTGSRWNIGPTLDATFGNKTAKAPNSGALSVDLRYFIPGTPTFRTNITVSPILRTDRSRDNEDLGSDIVLEAVIPKLERSLDERRKEEKRLKGPPLAIVWGWKLRPSVGFELGKHIKSSSAEVDNTKFSRLRVGLSGALEFGKWNLSTSVQHRYLFDRELVLQDGSVSTISDSSKTYGRVDLSYDLGVVGLTLTHLNGRQPPAFSSTHSTSLGLTFKF